MSTRKNHIRRTTLLAATLAATLLLASLAYAATQSGLLKRLFPGATPNPQAVRLETVLGQTQTDGDFSFTLNSFLLDGSDLYVDWSAESNADDAALLLVSQMQTTLGADKMIDNQDPNYPTMQEGALLEGEYKRYDGMNIAHYYGDAISEEEPFDVTLSAFFMQPLAPIKTTDELGTFTKTPMFEINDREEDGVRMLSLIDEHQTDDNEDGIYEINLYESLLWAAYEAHYREHPDMSAADRNQQVIEQLGYANTLARMDFTFTVDPSAKPIEYTVIDGQDTFAFDEFTIQFTKADFNAASVNIKYLLTTNDKTPGLNSGHAAESGASLWFKILPDGKESPIHFSQMLDDARGNNIRDGEIWGDPLSEIPSYVTFIPYVETYDNSDLDHPQRTETPLPDLQFTLHLSVIDPET